jgi:hypothetical protein
MWVATLVLGIILGAFGYALLGLVWLAKQIIDSKPKAESKPMEVAAVGVDIAGNNTMIDAYHKRMIDNVMKYYHAEA